MAKKMCKICGEKPATVPDRERVGKPINRVCSLCHATRLAGDMKRIVELHDANKTLERDKACPYDTDGDGDCGKPGCQVCSHYKI